MKLVVGIGNPEKKYDRTRQNIGFRVLDHYLPDADWQTKFNAMYYKKTIKGEIVYFIKPLTYVNLSGIAVREYVNYFDIALEDILIIQDDLAQEIGSYKLKKNSSSGGHNGIKSIIQELGSEEFARLKIGIKNDYLKDTVSFVLGKFTKKDNEIIENNLDVFDDIIDSFIKKGIDYTMNIYNRKYNYYGIFK